MGKERYKPEEIVEAIRAKRGIVTKAADMLGCSSETIYNYGERYKAVAAAIREERRRFVDNAKTGLLEAVDKQEPWAILFTLKTLGKDEGFGESTTIDLNATVRLEWPSA